jgi:hypothetical protein
MNAINTESTGIKEVKDELNRIITNLEIAYDIATNDEVIEILDDAIDRLDKIEGVL